MQPGAAGVVETVQEAASVDPAVNSVVMSDAGLTIGLAPVLWGGPVWGEEWIFYVIAYIAFSYYARFWD